MILQLRYSNSPEVIRELYWVALASLLSVAHTYSDSQRETGGNWKTAQLHYTICFESRGIRVTAALRYRNWFKLFT